MFNLAIVDDEITQTKLLSSLVKKWAEQHNIIITIQTFLSAESFHFTWCENKSFDVLLLDIQMSGMSGVELAKEIRKQDESLSVIFITGLTEYIQEGYEVSALHYLLKPVKEDKLFACLDKACLKLKKEQPSIIVNTESETVRLLQEEIIYVEAFAHYTFLQTTKASYEIKMGISELEKALLKPFFIRCHRSYIVGLNYIAKIGRTELTLDSGKSLPVSRRLYGEVNQAFIKFHRKEGE